MALSSSGTEDRVPSIVGAGGNWAVVSSCVDFDVPLVCLKAVAGGFVGWESAIVGLLAGAEKGLVLETWAIGV